MIVMISYANGSLVCLHVVALFPGFLVGSSHGDYVLVMGVKLLP